MTTQGSATLQADITKMVENMVAEVNSAIQVSQVEFDKEVSEVSSKLVTIMLNSVKEACKESLKYDIVGNEKAHITITTEELFYADYFSIFAPMNEDEAKTAVERYHLKLYNTVHDILLNHNIDILPNFDGRFNLSYEFAKP